MPGQQLANAGKPAQHWHYRLSRNGRQVLGMVLNCSESGPNPPQFGLSATGPAEDGGRLQFRPRCGLLRPL